MGEIVDSGGRALTGEAGGEEDASAMERRIFRGMCVAVALAVALGGVFAPWRVTTGLLLGGLLSLLNHHWLRTSVAAMFGRTLEGARPKLRLSRYVLRYVVIAAVVYAAHRLEAVSLVATLVGLCSFVPAVLFEGFTQLYRAVFHREETD
ncbi:MAG TPA: ATP synthase subunit I [Pyrinomonadaceae bacterium]|nr:ATP synthase subunit I [Pyrinomonadaceae bacterium]